MFLQFRQMERQFCFNLLLLENGRFIDNFKALVLPLTFPTLIRVYLR